MAAQLATFTTQVADGGNMTIDKPASTVEGDFLLCVVQCDPDGNVPSMTGFSAITHVNVGTYGDWAVFYKFAGGSEGATYTITADANAARCATLMRITGVDNTTPFDIAPSASTSVEGATGTTNAAPSISPTGSDSLLITAHNNISTFATVVDFTAAPSGMSFVSEIASPAGWIETAVFSQALTASGATGTRTPTMSPAAGSNWVAFSMAVKSASASGDKTATATLAGTGAISAIHAGGSVTSTTGVLYATGTPTTGQSNGSWATATNATGAPNAARAVWTSTGSGATGWIIPAAYGAQTTIGSQPGSIDQVEVIVYAYTSNTSRMASIDVQLADNGTVFGSPQSMTKSTSTTYSQTFTFTGVTWAQLANLGVRVFYTRGSVTTAATGSVDAASINVTYTRSAYNNSTWLQGTGSITAAGTAAAGNDFTGTATLTGTGAITSAQVAAFSQTASLSGTGTFTSTQSYTGSSLTGTTTRPGTGSVTADGVRGTFATTTLTGTATIFAMGPLTVGVTTAVANAWLASYSNPYIQLHTADPGASGTNAISAGSSTRVQGTTSAAANGAISLSTPTGQWTNTTTTETLTHVSMWSAASGGTYLGSTVINPTMPWRANSRFKLNTLSISLYVIPGGGGGGTPSEPLNVTSITRDAGADVSWYAPTTTGDSAITHYLITPYDGATPLSTTTVAVASTTAVTDSYGTTARRYAVTGLTNGTAYTFKVAARNTQGDGPQSAASGANTPLAGLVFGDDFNGPANGRPDPEWWVYDRCGYLAQNEVQYYKQTHCVLDGSGSLKVTAERVNTSGPRYPTDPSYPGTIVQPWRSGACQSNTRLFYPAAGHSMTFEARFQVNPNAGDGYWPGFFWLEGQDYLEAWKTDPFQAGWDSTGKAEIDVAEWYLTGAANSYGNVSWAGSNQQTNITGDGTLASQMHTYQAIWTPGTNVVFKRDGTTTATHTQQVPASGAQFFLMIYMQMLSTSNTATESAYVDWVRVYEN